MSLTVKHLNGDTTFLLIFSPDAHRPPDPPSHQPYYPPGTFSVLIDPWLAGTASMWHPKFLLSKHTTPSWIQDLSQIPEPNIVLVTQDKPDHCHGPTLKQLDPFSPVTMVLAEPAAAKRIRGMKHFDPCMVHDLRPFSRKDQESVIRFCIPAIVEGGTSGEATISFVQGKLDVAGVHNAVGITYKPPSKSVAPERPFTAPTQHSRSFSGPQHHLFPSESSSAGSPLSSVGAASSQGGSIFEISHARTASSTSSITSSIRYPHQTEKCLSAIYSPHGVSYDRIHSFAATHLVAEAALPLTTLLHSFNRVNNPWWMGGNVAAGSPGGAEIARKLMARCWIGAHDEEKDNTGISVANVKTKKFSLQEVIQDMVGSGTQVLNLGVGEEITLKSLGM